MTPEDNSTSTHSYADKRGRNEQSDASPSCVIHIRSLPQTITEREVANLTVPFGPVHNMVVSKKNGQALVQMETLSDAMDFIAYFSEFPFYFHGRKMLCQYSKYSQLDTHTENNLVKNALAATNKLVSQDLAESKSDNPITVLRVLIDNVMNQEINHITLLKMFRKYGEVLRMIIFMRDIKYNCLVEFADYHQAYVTLLALNGQSIYTGCCSLNLEFSKLRGPLEVRNESDKCRDYVRTPLSRSEMQQLEEPDYPPCPDAYMGRGVEGPPYAGMMKPPSIGEISSQLSSIAQQAGYNLTPEAAAATANFMALTALGGLPAGASGQPPGGQAMSGPARDVPMSAVQPGLSPVVMVNNLDEEKVSPDRLFTLFGLYGDVLRVKILFQNKSTALIQFTDAAGAQSAIYNLNGQKLWNKPLKLIPSKHQQVKLPSSEIDVGFTKDYTNSRLHRFRKPNSKNYQNIYPPSSMLHLSNIPPEVEERDILEIFESNGFNVRSFRFMPKDRRMAFLQLDNADIAMQAIMALHNHPLLSDAAHLRLSFSKNTSS